jgi:hypothetical protein
MKAATIEQPDLTALARKLRGMAALACVGIGFTALPLGILFVAVMHGILIYVGVGLMKKPFAEAGRD